MEPSAKEDTVSDDYRPEYFLYHSFSPRLRATFSSASDARVWAIGNVGQPYADLFYIEDENGNRVTFKQNAYGHAYAVREATK